MATSVIWLLFVVDSWGLPGTPETAFVQARFHSEVACRKLLTDLSVKRIKWGACFKEEK
jgi:hypothetical protein